MRERGDAGKKFREREGVGLRERRNREKKFRDKEVRGR